MHWLKLGLHALILLQALAKQKLFDENKIEKKTNKIWII
jgi:hypothetical protein